jgi:hypothetical protein
LPYDRLSPHQDIVSERLAILANMPQKGILLVSASTLAQRVAPYSWVVGEHFDIKVGQRLDLEAQKKQLVQAIVWLILFMIMGNLQFVAVSWTFMHLDKINRFELIYLMMKLKA